MTKPIADPMAELPYKQWISEEAKRLGIKEGALRMRVQLGRAKPQLRRVNKRVVFVQIFGGIREHALRLPCMVLERELMSARAKAGSWSFEK